jgi:hypothetical protein
MSFVDWLRQERGVNIAMSFDDGQFLADKAHQAYMVYLKARQGKPSMTFDAWLASQHGPAPLTPLGERYQSYLDQQKAAGQPVMTFDEWLRTSDAPPTPAPVPYRSSDDDAAYREYLREQEASGQPVMTFDEWLAEDRKRAAEWGTGPLDEYSRMKPYIEYARMKSNIEWGPLQDWEGVNPYVPSYEQTQPVGPDLSTTQEPGPAPSTDTGPAEAVPPSVEYKPDEHSPECVKWYWHLTNQREHWAVLFPRHCANCEGWGFVNIDTHQPSNLSAYATEAHVTQCPRCLMVDNCPRCGHNLTKGDGIGRSKCLFCAWTPGMHGKEHPPVCICRNEEADDATEK